MPNVWKWKAKGGDGKPVEASPGAPFFISRGPRNVPDMKQAAAILLYGKRMEAVRAGLPDPGYVLDGDPEPYAEDDTSPVGGWATEGARPVSLPTDPAVAADKAAFLEEQLNR